MRAMGYLHGIDVSDDQGAVDWVGTRGAVQFVMAQVGYGTRIGIYPTRTGAANMREHHGGYRGAYFYGYPLKAEAERQGREAATMALDAGWRPEKHLPLALDVEANPEAMEPAAMSDWIEAWLRGTGIDARHLAIYSNPAFWEANTDGRQVNAHLWVAAWGAASPPRLKGLPVPFCWQTTNRGRVPGIATAVDLDTLLFVPDAAKGPHEQPPNVQETPAGAILRPKGDV